LGIQHRRKAKKENKRGNKFHWVTKLQISFRQ